MILAKSKDDIVSDLITLTEAAGLIFIGFI
jgi:hypothetical protein